MDYSIVGLYKRYYSELIDGDTTEKQAGAMALMLTADKIAQDLFWPDMDMDLEVDWVREYLATKANVNVAERAYKHLLGIIGVNSMNFTNSSRVIWGKMDKDENPTQVFFIRTALEEQMRLAGFEFDAVKKPWNAKGYIEYNERSRMYTFLTRINGLPTHCVRINLPKTQPELTDYNEKTPFDAE